MLVESIKVKDDKDFVKVSDGAVFGFGGGFYIKMSYDINAEDETFNAVDLESGEPVFFDDEDEVTEYPRAKMYIE